LTPKVFDALQQTVFESADTLDELLKMSNPPNIRSKAFRRWFENSVVKNTDGTPKEVFHRSGQQFESFDIEQCEFGCHFGTEKQADDIVGGVIYRAYISIQNPLRLVDEGNWGPRNVMLQLVKLDLVTENEEIRFGSIYGEEKQKRYLLNLLDERGYDGLVYLNRREGYNRNAEVVAWARIFGLRMTDEEWLTRYPQAEDSYAVFFTDQVRIIDLAAAPQAPAVEEEPFKIKMIKVKG
jgi:hypothetical protein